MLFTKPPSLLPINPIYFKFFSYTNLISKQPFKKAKIPFKFFHLNFQAKLTYFYFRKNMDLLKMILPYTVKTKINLLMNRVWESYTVILKKFCFDLDKIYVSLKLKIYLNSMFFFSHIFHIFSFFTFFIFLNIFHNFFHCFTILNFHIFIHISFYTTPLFSECPFYIFIKF